MAVEGEQAPAVETPDPANPAEAEELAAALDGEGTAAEGDAEKTPEQVAAEALAAEEAAKAKPAEIPEDVLKAAAVKHANKTMAAARRAEARVETVKAENTKLSGEIGTYREFVQQLASGDPAALARVGFKSPRDYLDKVVAFGGERPAPTAEDRVAALEKKLGDREQARAQADATAKVEASKAAVFKAIDADTARFDLATTDVGHEMLWQAVEAYFDEHKECPDEAVYALAEEVEKDLAAKLAKSKKFNGHSQPANKGTPAGTASPATLNPGKTLTGKGSAGAPSVKEYSPDDNVRRKQLEDELRAEGLL